MINLKSDKETIFDINVIYEDKSDSILFKIESKDILPTKIFNKQYTFEDMKKISHYFNNCNDFKNNKDIYDTLTYLINHKENEKKLKEQSDKLILIITFFCKSKITFQFEQKPIDIIKSIKDLYYLYNKLKEEKNNEINNLNERLNENEKKYKIENDNLKKEINKLRKEYNDEIKMIKKKYDFEIKKERNNIENLINKIKQLEEENNNKFDDIDDLQNENNQKLRKLNEKLEEICQTIDAKMLFLQRAPIDDYKYFETIMEQYYKSIYNENLCLFQERHKVSYDCIVYSLFKTLNGNHGTNPNELFEFGEENYKNYSGVNWNYFLLNNIFRQMIFSDDIEINENGVEQMKKKLNKFNNELTNFDLLLQLLLLIN